MTRTTPAFTPPGGALSVNDGQTQSGWIVKRGTDFVAFGVAGERLGKFKTQAAAMAAIPVITKGTSGEQAAD
jgi:hypothetical protein